MSQNSDLIRIRNLRTYFHTEEGVGRAVDGVSWSIAPSRTLGLVGESGCGKSVTAMTILRLVQCPPGRIESGEVLYRGKDLLTISEAQMRRIRGKEISMIFQEPMTSLNPVYTCGEQVMEVLRLHERATPAEARSRTVEMFHKVGIPSPEMRVDEYPHQMSGGMKQRVMIAMALACNPKMLIADEPTTALDVTIQAQILELMKELQREFGAAILMITHDLGVIAETADEVAVMYAGKVVEHASAEGLFDNPLHPYTQGLFRSRPSVHALGARLQVIPGMVPNPLNFPSGCRFHPRCPRAVEECKVREPELRAVGAGRLAACHLVKGAEGVGDGT